MYKSKYPNLIQHLMNEHDLILLNSEIQEIERSLDKDLNSIGKSLPSTEEIQSAIKEISKKSTAPDKETPDWMQNDIENGINWVLKYLKKNNN